MSKAEMSEISTQLGILIGQNDIMKKSIDDLNKSHSETAIVCNDLKNDISSVHTRIDTLIKELQPTISHANDYAENKKKLIYGAWGVGALGVTTIMTLSKDAWEGFIHFLK